jgi:hypothetical protein
VALGAEHAGHLEQCLDASVPENRLASCEWQTSERCNVEMSQYSYGQRTPRTRNRNFTSKTRVFSASQAGLLAKPRGAAPMHFPADAAHCLFSASDFPSLIGNFSKAGKNGVSFP